MRRAFHAPVAAITILALGLGQTGCVTSKKYKMAKDGAPPASPLGWNVANPPAEMTLATLIVFKGPGSWKREARWDEYVLRLTNHGTEPLRIDQVTLIDLLGAPQVPGVDPWQLEKLSYTNWDKYGGVGLSLVAGAGVVVIYGSIAYAAAMGSMLSGFGGAAGAAAGAGGGAAALAIIPIFAVVDIAAVAVMNHQNKGKVQAEFTRRRLALPLTIAPAATVEGSYFFPMTPGPQRLVLKGKAGEIPLELVLELKQLAGLHLKPPEKK